MSHYAPRTTSPSRQTQRDHGPRNSGTSIHQPQEPRYSNPIFARAGTRPASEPDPQANYEIGRSDRASTQPRASPALLIRLARSVPVNSYTALQKFVEANAPQIWDGSIAELVQEAIDCLAFEDRESEVLAISCIEKAVIIDECRHQGRSVTFITQLRARDPTSTEYFQKKFTELKKHCERKADHATTQTKEALVEPLPERHAAHGRSAGIQSRHELQYARSQDHSANEERHSSGRPEQHRAGRRHSMIGGRPDTRPEQPTKKSQKQTRESDRPAIISPAARPMSERHVSKTSEKSMNEAQLLEKSRKQAPTTNQRHAIRPTKKQPKEQRHSSKTIEPSMRQERQSLEALVRLQEQEDRSAQSEQNDSEESQSSTEKAYNRHAYVEKATSGNTLDTRQKSSSVEQQPRGSSIALGGNLRQESSQQLERPERGPPEAPPRRERRHEASWDTEVRRRQTYETRHAVVTPHNGRSASGGSRSGPGASASRQGLSRGEYILPVRPSDRHSNMETLPETESLVLHQSAQPSDAARRHRDNLGSEQTQQTPPSSGGSRGLGPTSFPSRPPNRPPSFRGAQTIAFDPNFQVVPTNRWDSYFRRGRVFAILTYSQDTGGSVDSVWTTRDNFNQRIFAHVRRMVIVGRGRGFCWAIPIKTYRGQGLSRPGLSPRNIAAHAIIHMSDTEPSWLPNEPQSAKRPIAVDPADTSQRLERASRIDFERVHTVELNVSIQRIVTVTDASLPFLMEYFGEEMRNVTA